MRVRLSHFVALGTAACTLASPALAQASQHMENVEQTADGYTCRSRALPDLMLTHDWRGGDRSAGMRFDARESGADELRMRAAFVPAQDRPFGTATSIPGFDLRLGAAPLRDRPHAAQLRIDGLPDATVLVVESGSVDRVSVAVIERQREPLAERLMRAAIVEVDLLDSTGAPLRRFGWDVRRLRRAPELLQLVNWSCN